MVHILCCSWSLGKERCKRQFFFAFPVKSERQFLCRTQFVCIAASPRSFLRWLATPVLCAMLFDLFQKSVEVSMHSPLTCLTCLVFFSPGPQRPRLRARGHQRGHGTSLEVILRHVNPKLVKLNLLQTQTWKNRALSLKHLSSENKKRGCLGYVGDYTT